MNAPHRLDLSQPSLNGPTSPRPLRVLVVDDHRDAADSLAMLLRLAGHEVWVAYDGPSALVTASSCRPEVVFLDLGLPGLDGFGVAAWLRDQEALAGVILVALTGLATEKSRQRATEVGFDHFFLKPTAFEELDRIVAGARQTGTSPPAPAV